MATEQDWTAYADQSVLNDGDTILARTAAGAGVEVPATALVRVRAGGNVGIGSSTPQQLLHLEQATFPKVRFFRTGIGYWDVGGNGSTNSFAIGVNGGSPSFSIAVDGAIGIGTDTPAASSTLHVKAPANPGGNRIAALLQNPDNTAGTTVTLAFSPHSTAGIVGTISSQITAPNNYILTFATHNAGGLGERMRLDHDGNLLVGVTTASPFNSHVISKAAAQGSNVVVLTNGTTETAAFGSVSGTGYNVAGAAIWVNKHSSTNRSINAAGTVNASGADYAEYMQKAEGCGPIAAGDVCGVTADGELTRKWADAIAFVVKSTSPAYVGGDTWGTKLPPRPEEPVSELPTYNGPSKPEEPGDAPEEPVYLPEPEAFNARVPTAPQKPQRTDEDDIAWAERLSDFALEQISYRIASSQFEAQKKAHARTVQEVKETNEATLHAHEKAVKEHTKKVEEYTKALALYKKAQEDYNHLVEAAQAEHAKAITAYKTALTEWEAGLEEARSHVDRIAFSGQVPVNFEGECSPGDYLIAAPNGSGIKATAVSPDTITFEQYRLRLGRVWAIGKDGRPVIDAQHG